MNLVNMEFCASNLGGPETPVLARFVTDDRGLHVERLDRREARWVHDSTVAGFLTGHYDWAERISRERANQIVSSWDLSPAILDAPLVEPAST
ncbi:MAG TPA: hypothetical protein VK988_11005 [Acidimicrobiales bacterium]|nr:hypothetical protein [Acidimicrobiales bacterium]